MKRKATKTTATALSSIACSTEGKGPTGEVMHTLMVRTAVGGAGRRATNARQTVPTSPRVAALPLLAIRRVAATVPSRSLMGPVFDGSATAAGQASVTIKTAMATNVGGEPLVPAEVVDALPKPP